MSIPATDAYVAACLEWAVATRFDNVTLEWEIVYAWIEYTTDPKGYYWNVNTLTEENYEC